MLPEQVRSTFNASLRWRRGPVTVSLRSKYRGVQLRDLTEPGQDQFAAGTWSHSVSGQYSVNSSTSLSLGLSKLNRPEFYAYQGTPDRPLGNRQGTLFASLSLSIRFAPQKPVKPGQSK